MAESVDARDSKSRAARRASSSLARGTIPAPSPRPPMFEQAFKNIDDLNEIAALDVESAAIFGKIT
jgi:hypothetical protein